jgi:hypothetical protein
MYVKKTLAALGAASAMTLAGIGAAAPAQAQGPIFTGGLVNVTLVDVVDVNNNQVIVQVPIAVAANVCDLNVAVLAVIQDDGDVACEATAEAVANAPARQNNR